MHFLLKEQAKWNINILNVAMKYIKNIWYDEITSSCPKAGIF